MPKMQLRLLEPENVASACGGGLGVALSLPWRIDDDEEEEDTVLLTLLCCLLSSVFPTILLPWHLFGFWLLPKAKRFARGMAPLKITLFKLAGSGHPPKIGLEARFLLRCSKKINIYISSSFIARGRESTYNNISRGVK